MKLVQVSEETFINPEAISYIERHYSGKASIWIGDKEMLSHFSFDTIISMLKIGDPVLPQPEAIRPQQVDLAY